MTKETNHQARPTARTKGQEVVEGLRNSPTRCVREAPGGSLPCVCTRSLPRRSIAARTSAGCGVLSISQAAFAAFLGADPSTVRSWSKPPSTQSPGVPAAVGDRGRPRALATAARGVPACERMIKFSSALANGDMLEDAEDLVRGLNGIFPAIDERLEAVELEKAPNGPRGHDPEDGVGRRLVGQVEPLGGHHLGQALRDSGHDVLILGLDHDAHRGRQRELLGPAPGCSRTAP